MTSPRPEHAAMETFTVPLPRRLFRRLFGRSPLIRASDRVEALVLVLAVAVSLLTVPIAAAVGTATYDARSRLYAEQAQNRHAVIATVTGSAGRENPESSTVMVPAQWYAAGAEHTGDVLTQRGARVGDEIEIWVDSEGSPIGRPAMTALDEAVSSAMAIWCAVTLSAVAVYAGARVALDRRRDDQWQRDFDRLIARP
ncbi:hypothetical protein BST11_10975 [Mycobacterium alsense]|uniref:Transmembrane protein n=1 Tax=Mycobacterium alsense TaxID=324058 RepID=A0AA42BY55_9MYCO|nr:hypothetical protein [Mycobacterium alsense]MCV7378488.1 hypothetical protein [Mycobacterium alsense]OQZ90910.1 hypothetical protein BST11_10975 [Mycobacterium alsense]